MLTRLHIASVLACAIVIAPILATLDRSASLYQLVSGLMLCFGLSLLPEAWREIRALWESLLIRLSFWIAPLLLLGWKLCSGPMWHSERTVFYLILPVFYTASVGWIRSAPRTRLKAVFISKLFITSVAAIWIGIEGYLESVTGQPAGVAASPPIYLHFRHVNPDIFYVLVLVPLFWMDSPRTRLLLAACLVPLGYFSVWSGERAEFLALAIFCALLFFSRTLKLADRRLWQPALYFITGGLLVFALGQTYFVSNFMDRTLSNSSDELTSGRVPIWEQSLHRLGTDSSTLMLGFGPDAYKRIGISRDMTSITGYVNPTSHPHNTIVLWLLEFGLIGALPLILLSANVLWCNTLILWRARVRTKVFEPTICVAAVLIATFVFSLLDCQFYYAAPLSFFLLLAAFQRATGSVDNQSAAVNKASA